MTIRSVISCAALALCALFPLHAEELNGACLTLPDGSLEAIFDKSCSKDTFNGVRLWSECKYAEAQHVFQQQAEKGDGLAKAALGLMLIRGYDGKPDAEAGISLLEDGAESGWTDAYYYLAYIHGTPGPFHNYDKAYDYAKKAFPEDKGTALIRMAECYMELYDEGNRDITLFREALRCASSAGEMGNSDGYDCAAHACFTIHRHAEKEAQQVLQDLVPLSDDAKGIILEILFSGKRFSECEQRAKEFLETYDYAFAKYTLALLYLQHINPDINTEKGLRLMREGAENGDSKSIWGMVCMCDNPRKHAPGNKKLKPDYEQALRWYREAEKLEDELSRATAKAEIARYYAEGKGCRRNIQEAVRLLHESVSLCETEEAQKLLSEMKKKARKGDKYARSFLSAYQSIDTSR